MKISKIRIKNYRSIKDSGDIVFNDRLFVLAGQNESGKSSILSALNTFATERATREDLNFELENDGNMTQEISVSYSLLDDTFYSNIMSELFALIKTKNPEKESIELQNVLLEEKLKDIKEFTVVKTFNFHNNGNISSPNHIKLSPDTALVILLDKSTLGKVTGAILNYNIDQTNEQGNGKATQKEYIESKQYATEIAKIFCKNAMEIILFNDFQSLLPDKIFLDDLKNNDAEGIKAVRNIEKLLRVSFGNIAMKSTPQKNATSEKESNTISGNFQQDWQQKIYGNNKVNIKFFIENNEQGKKEISFVVETKDSEYLAPRKRSQGMIWFLSLWLELKARENNQSLLLLFDEPGLHLHIKANKDMLSVFHKLINKGHQIIYSTHSPALIETDRLQNIGLVINSEESGTTVEGLTTSKINTNNKKDALQPIAEAMGMEPLKDFSVLKEKNVLLEGLSDFWYFKGMSKLLNRSLNYEFIPGIGIKGNKINHLISFCIGYGLEWLLVVDGGKLPNQLRDELKTHLFSDDDAATDEKIKLINVEEIENLFDVQDLILVDNTIKTSTKTPIEVIGEKRKVVFAKMFMQKVASNEIKRTDLQPKTIENFEEVFSWIESKFMAEIK